MRKEERYQADDEEKDEGRYAADLLVS